MKFVKRDVVLWLRHLEEAGVPVPSGCAALFRVGDRDILFEPMRPSPSGRPTLGLRTTDANRANWSSIPLGAAIDLELVRVLDEDAAVPLLSRSRSLSVERAFLAGFKAPRCTRSSRALALTPTARGAFLSVYAGCRKTWTDIRGTCVLTGEC